MKPWFASLCVRNALLVVGIVLVTATPSLAVPDSDNDGFPDDIDNCPQVANPDQLDQDQDGKGDVCDACPLDSNNDFDADGICDPPDNCPFDANPGQEDMNGNGVGDRCDFTDGFILVDVPDPTHLNWQRDTVCDGFNLYRGDLYVLRSTGVYTQGGAVPLAMHRCAQYVPTILDSDPIPAGSAEFYVVACTRGGTSQGLGENSAGVPRPEAQLCPACDLPFVTIFKRFDSGLPAQDRLIDNLADWCAFWPAQCGTSLIDFSTHVALATVLAGPVSCDNVQMTCVRTGASPPDVQVTKVVQTGQGCLCSPAFHSPIHVVRLPRPVGTATFITSSAPLCP